MLHIVMGMAGTGKSTLLLEKINDAVQSGGRAILLVPEQLSFESERKLYRQLGPRRALQVDVLSFTRLCNSVFRAFGGIANTPVTPAAKYLLMSIAVDELRDSLNVYRKSAANTSFLQTLVEACAEFKTAGVMPEALSQAAAHCEGPLGDKLTDISGIYGAYQALLDKGYSDTDDDLIRACALLESGNFFANYNVFIDGFTTFMAAEFELLGHVIAQSPEVWFAMTCDGPGDNQGGMGVFSPAQKAIARLSRMAAQQRGPVDLVECGEQRRYHGAGLSWISRQFMQPEAIPSPVPAGDGVKLHVAANRYSELEYVAASIARLVRDSGLRYRQIAVVARDTGPYLRAMETVFGHYGIPYFADQLRSAENHPLVAGLLHAVDAVRSNFDTEPVLQLAKNPLLGLDLEAVARLENYCYCWGVRGAAWLDDFGSNPRGMAGPLTEEDREALGGINATRSTLIEPLARLKEALAQGAGQAFATGLYAYLQEVDASAHLSDWASALPQDERAGFLAESAQLWDTTMEILDVFGSVLGNVRMKRARLCDLLHLALETEEVGLIPQTLDQVLVGKADRIRPVDIDTVFVIGAVEGEFPAQVVSGGVFSDAERQKLIDAGVELSPPALQRSVLEKFFAYFAVTLASHRLIVTYPKADLAGQELLPSVIPAQIAALFPGLQPHQPEAEFYAVSEPSAFALLAGEYGKGTRLEASLRAFFAGAERQTTLARMDRARRRPPHLLEDRSLARGLFGDRMRLSPTRVERFYRCPFSYFAADGLKLRPRQKVEFTPLESGSVIHNVLQVMVQRHGGKGLLQLTEDQLQEEVAEIIRGYLDERVEEADKLPVRFRYLFTRLTGMLARLLLHIGREFAQSEFSPAAFELPISAEAGIEPLQLMTADGVPVAVEGVVDRVDIMEKNGKRYVRVVDYKSGAKTFSLHDILYGINMQMLLYLFTIQEHGIGDLADAVPAGVLYMPVRERFVSADRETADAAVAAEREKQWRMSGLLLEDEEVLRGMEQDLAGIFIPAKLGKNGLDAKSSLAGKAEMGRLSRKVRELVVQMADALSAGGIGATPTNSPDFDACAYCDYRAVCGYEPGDPVREIAKMDRAEVLKLLEEEQEADGLSR